MKICVLTGTRAEYGLLKPVIDSINAHPNLDLVLLVTGMHLLSEFGETVNEIKNDGFEVKHEIYMNPETDTLKSMASAIGVGVKEIADFFSRNLVDVLLILGDRIEALAATIAAAYMNIPIAHIHGGDSAKAGLDESARHAITKFAHIHFPATQKSAERILKLGEDKWRITVTGAPCLDTILHIPLLSREELEAHLNMKLNNQYILLVQHPVTTQFDLVENQIDTTLKAIERLGKQTVIIYPNSDAGGRKIISKIEDYSSKLSHIECFKNLSHKTYLSLMKHADVMVGNSSSGIIESSSFKLPVVNIGIRQEGRERANNVINVKHDVNEIVNAINKGFSNEFKKSLKDCINPYGDGRAGQKVVEVLSKLKINHQLMQKKITY